jgi:hypothetical protein
MMTKTCLQYCKSWVKKDIVGLAAHCAFGYVMATHVSLYLIHILHTCVTDSQLISYCKCSTVRPVYLHLPDR